MLTPKAFTAAGQVIQESGRPLEITRFHYAFGDGPIEAVLEALKKYQNTDGGFGHALEPDLRAPASSALCTSIAFQLLRALQAEDTAFSGSLAGELASGGLTYLLGTLDQTRGHWRIIPLEAGDSPHAPWWGQEGREDALDEFSLNPTAELLGYLYDYQEQAPGELLSFVTGRVLQHLGELQEIEMHDLMCCLRLLKTRRLPGDIAADIYSKLNQLIDSVITYDPGAWGGYGLLPLQVIDAPDSPFMVGREAAVEANLDYEISTQGADGAWHPTWTWGGMFPDAWAQAELEWTSLLTLEKLLLLKRFNWIEW